MKIPQNPDRPFHSTSREKNEDASAISKAGLYPTLLNGGSHQHLYPLNTELIPVPAQSIPSVNR